MLKRPVMLISGGPDSATLAAWIRKRNENEQTELHALYLKQGKAKDGREIEAADTVLRRLRRNSFGARLEIIDISDMARVAGGFNAEVLIHSGAQIMLFGNLLALSVAMSYAFKVGAREVFIGLHRDDAVEDTQYTRAYLDRIEGLAELVQSPHPKLVTPFIELSKAEVIALATGLGVDLSATWSCIGSHELHCGTCGACRARRRAFEQARVDDPTTYRSEPMALASSASH